jgi:hypothetical protein
MRWVHPTMVASTQGTGMGGPGYTLPDENL